MNYNNVSQLNAPFENLNLTYELQKIAGAAAMTVGAFALLSFGAKAAKNIKSRRSNKTPVINKFNYIDAKVVA